MEEGCFAFSSEEGEGSQRGIFIVQGVSIVTQPLDLQARRTMKTVHTTLIVLSYLACI